MAEWKPPHVLTDAELAAYGLPTGRRRTRKGLSWQEKRTIVFRRDNYRCVYCGSTEGPFHCDHVVAHTQRGSDELDNLATACRNCNLRKHNKTVSAFKEAGR